MYLGRYVTCNDFHDSEIQNRMTKAWAAFAKNKAELCGRHYPLRARLRLFEATVTATALYGSGTWTMTTDREKLLTTTCRRMLRKMLGTPRRQLQTTSGNLEEETWVDWIVRATSAAESEQKKAGLSTWVDTQRQHKERLLDKIHTSNDGRWSLKIINWEPRGSRRVGRPLTRWTDTTR